MINIELGIEAVCQWVFIFYGTWTHKGNYDPDSGIARDTTISQRAKLCSLRPTPLAVSSIKIKDNPLHPVEEFHICN